MRARRLLKLEDDGAELVAGALQASEVESILLALHGHDAGRPGLRLSELKGLHDWLGPEGMIGRIAAKWLGPRGVPVRAILFDKNATSNWALGWHQDRTIAVSKRDDVSGFNNWNRKDGVDHVEPPFDLIERMLTVRIHLDAASHDNAPLLICPGTHRLGKIAESSLPEIARSHGSHECIAATGDVWVYRTAIVHASKRSASPSRRRVLQVDYSADELPAPLSWKLQA